MPGRVPMLITHASGHAIRPSLKYWYTPLGIATILYTKLVALTAGLVKPKALIWNGNRMKAPDKPARDENTDTTNATTGGINTHVVTPDEGKNA